MPPVKNEQTRHLKIVWAALALLALLMVGAGGLLYMGVELPPLDLRSYYASPDDYAPPPRTEVVPAGSVARGTPLPEPAPMNAAAALSPGESAPPAADAWRNPAAADPQAVAAGKRAYAVNCAMCHGEPGKGIGPVGEAYTPRPPDLAASARKRSDGYLYYVTSYGIRSTPTAEATRYLPREWHAFAPLLRPDERQAIVAYMAGFR